MAKGGMPLYFDTGEDDDDDNKSFVNFYATIQWFIWDKGTVTRLHGMFGVFEGRYYRKIDC